MLLVWRQGGKFLCIALGKSRSAGIVAAWLMERGKLTYEESLEIIRTVRPRACPNLGFALQLRKRGRCLYHKKQKIPANVKTIMSLRTIQIKQIPPEARALEVVGAVHVVHFSLQHSR